jgi:hypothetical protein
VRIASVISALVLLGVPSVASLAHAQSSGSAAVVSVHTQSERDGLWLHYRVGRAWAVTCASPCEAVVERGAALGVSLDGRHVQLAEGSPLLAPGTTLLLGYQSHSEARALGAVAVVVGAIAGVLGVLFGAMFLVEDLGSGAADGSRGAIAGGIGIGTLTLGLSVGIPFMTERDRAAVATWP